MHENNHQDDLDAQLPQLLDGAEEMTEEDQYEEISSDEVDRVIQSLEDLMESVDSENVRAYLEAAADSIYSLVYETTDFVEIEEDPQNQAA